MPVFRIKIWPETKRIEVPPVDLWEVDVVDREAAFGGPFLVFGSPRGVQKPPEELYLRELRDLDIKNVDAVAAFCASYGRLGLPRWQEIHPDRPLFTFEMDKLRQNYRPPGSGLEDDPHASPKDRIEKQVQVQRDLDSRFVPLAEAAAYAALVRDLTRIWQFHGGRLGLEQLIEAWENPFYSDPRYRKLDPEMAHIILVETLGYALSAFRVRPILLIEHDDRLVEEDWGLGEFSLYAALCLQLANDIAEQAEYRTCRKCGRLFFRQSGRARFGQHRTKGEALPIYCSKECAHNAAQKRYAHQKRAKQAGGSSEKVHADEREESQ